MEKNRTGPIAFPMEYQDAFIAQVAHVRELLALFDHLPATFLFIKDRAGRFAKVNRAEALLHGLGSESEMIGKTDHDFHPPALASQYVEEDRRVMSSRQTLADQRWLVLGADGMPRWYSCTKVPLTDVRNRVIGIAGIMQPLDQAGETPGEYRRLIPALEFVLAHYGEEISIREMARRSHLSVSHLQREFARLFGITPSEYLLRVRLLMARFALERTADAVGDISLRCGFYDQSHFTRSFRKAVGLAPLAYRRRFASPNAKPRSIRNALG